jgi:hypothetical protein
MPALDMTGAERHQRAVANTLGLAREAAVSGHFAAALEWLAVVEIVDGALPTGWELTRALWLRGQATADGDCARPAAAGAAAAGSGVGRG